jgi:hypothetical protein
MRFEFLRPDERDEYPTSDPAAPAEIRPDPPDKQTRPEA